MRKRHKIKKFTAEEIVILTANQFTYNVTASQIIYTSEFKNIFLARYEAGENAKEIFESLDYDTAVLGNSRIYDFAHRLAKQAAKCNLLSGTSFEAAGTMPGKENYTTNLSPQSIAAMQMEIAYLRQQVDFLKKITALDNSRK